MQELIVLEDVNALAIFKDGGAEAILSRIEEQVRAEVPDVDTAKGRKAIASLARKVSSSKVLLDDAGKALVSDAKAKAEREETEKTNAERKRKADERHVSTVNQASFDVLRKQPNMSDDNARAALKAIIDGLVPHVTINY